MDVQGAPTASGNPGTTRGIVRPREDDGEETAQSGPGCMSREEEVQRVVREALLTFQNNARRLFPDRNVRIDRSGFLASITYLDESGVRRSVRDWAITKGQGRSHDETGTQDKISQPATLADDSAIDDSAGSTRSQKRARLSASTDAEQIFNERAEVDNSAGMAEGRVD